MDVWATWNTVFKNGREFGHVNDFFLDELITQITLLRGSDPKTALDLGCGTGRLVVKLAKRGLHVCGIDASSVALEKASGLARSHGITKCHVDFRLEDLERIDAKKVPEKYDIVFLILTYAFIHDHGRLLSFITTILGNRGAFVLTTPVMVDGISYDDTIQDISVPKTILERELDEHFSFRELFKVEYFSDLGLKNTYILHN